MYNLLIADDEPSMQDGLTNLVNWAELNCRVAGVCGDGESVIRFLERERVDALLMDIRMPNGTGLDVAEHVYKARNPVRIILLSGFQDFEYARQAMHCGVRHYLTKPVLPSLLVEAVREALCGLTPNIAESTPPHEHFGAENAQISKTMAYIEAHYAEKLTLTDAARNVFLNPTYLSRLFSEKAGCTFQRYLTQTRMNAAARLLTETKRPVSEICEAVGYSDLKHFYRAFNEMMGLSPNAYRNGKTLRS
jgi:YesN/AraC family two-component response regulator